MDLYGGKAAGLARLISLGFDVPPGFVLEADEPLDEGRLWRAVGLWAGGVDSTDGHARLAVRSSSTIEDSASSSHAGEFSTVIDDLSCKDLVAAIIEVRTSGRAGAGPIPAVVQRVVEPVIAGVAFSCDPVSYRRDTTVISWTEGLADGLVSGRDSGTTIAVDTDQPSHPNWPVSPDTLAALVRALGTIEGTLHCPADVEWAVDSDGTLWLLQARPVVLPKTQVVDANSPEALRELPSIVASHPKLQLRQAAAQRNVMMSKASVIVMTGADLEADTVEVIPSVDAAGISVVLLYPAHVEQQVQREFAQVDRTDVPLFTLGCRRYSIRRYPKLESACTVIDEVAARGLSASWLVSTVAQEIYDAEATGIVRRLGTDLVVEVARGHFVPKGVVDPSRLVLSEAGDVLESLRVEQNVVFHFINGFVVTEQPVERQIDLTDEDIAAAVMQISALFHDYPNAALEFGILKHRSVVKGYVIDAAEGDCDAAAKSLTKELIGSGVLSVGAATGTAVRINNLDSADLDQHLLSVLEGAADGNFSRAVIFADRASVDLLQLVARCGSETAFVFRNGSLLAHLSVVLRERGIPAVVSDDSKMWASVREGDTITIDARTEGLSAPARVGWEE